MNRVPKVMFGLLMIIALIAMILFPAASGHGSFQAVNGPTTVFQSLRAALLILWLVVALGTTVSARLAVAHSAVSLEQHASQSLPLLC